MAKTLEEAIGCWTAKSEYNDLAELSKMVRQSALACRRVTKKGDTVGLQRELEILAARLETMQGVTRDATRRLNEIIQNKELE